MDAASVRDVVEHILRIPAGVADDQPLERFGLDSIGLVRLVTALEKEIGGRIPVNEITTSSFVSIRSITEMVERIEGTASEHSPA